MPKLIAGAKRLPPTGPSPRALRIEDHKAAFRTSATDVTELIARLRRGRDLLAAMDGASAYRAEAETLWKTVILDLYLALRDAYAHYALIRTMSDDEDVAIALWHATMPNVDDLTKLGVKPLFEYYRGRLEPPMWVTDTERRLIGVLTWPPVPGEDIYDTGVRREFDEPPF